MIPFLAWTGSSSIHLYRSLPVACISLWLSLDRPILPTGNVASGGTPWRHGIWPFRSFPLPAWRGYCRSWCTICRPCLYEIIYVWIPGPPMEVGVVDYGFNSLLFPSFRKFLFIHCSALWIILQWHDLTCFPFYLYSTASSWIPFSLSFTRSPSSFCTGTITLPFFSTAGIRTQPNHPRVFSLSLWTTRYTPACTDTTFSQPCAWSPSGSIPW
jgi:hypothetical protein